MGETLSSSTDIDEHNDIVINIVSTGNDAVDRDLEMPGLRSLRPPLSLREHGRNTVTGTVPNKRIRDTFARTNAHEIKRAGVFPPQ